MLIEVIISIFIVGIVLVTFLTVMATSYRTEFAKRDIIIASNLAQEGIEIVRNIRDNNWKMCPGAPPACNGAFDPHFLAGNGLCISYDGNYDASTPTTTCTNGVLRVNGSGFYVMTAGTATKFHRTVNVSIPTADSRTITSIIWWGVNAADTSKKVTMTDTIYSWGNTE